MIRTNRYNLIHNVNDAICGGNITKYMGNVVNNQVCLEVTKNE